jgi:hypothetical protein
VIVFDKCGIGETDDPGGRAYNSVTTAEAATGG